MSIKIKVSYETEAELNKVLRLLDPEIKRVTKEAKQSGRYLRVYIELNPNISIC